MKQLAALPNHTHSGYATTAQLADYLPKSGTAANSEKLGGILPGYYFGEKRIPVIESNGVMEVGKYIDFHDGSDNVDYSVRIYTVGDNLNITGHVTARTITTTTKFVGALQGNADTATSATNASYLTSRSYDGDINANNLYYGNSFVLRLSGSNTNLPSNMSYGNILYVGGADTGFMLAGSFSHDKLLFRRGTNANNSDQTILTNEWKTVAFTSDIPTKVSQLTNDAGYTTATGHTHSYIPISEKVNANAVSHTGYGTNGTYVPTMDFLSYWNGAYNSNGVSNLTYCKRGAFGTIVTKNVGDYAAAGHTHSINNLVLNGIDADTTYGNYMGILQSPSIEGLPSGKWFNVIKILHPNSDGYYTELAQAFTDTEGLYHRRMERGTKSAWRHVLDSGNYTSYCASVGHNHDSAYLGKTAKAASASTADSATKATQDASGRVIIDTYATKAEVNAKTDTKNTAGTLNSTSKLFLVGAETQASETQTSSNSGVYMTNGTLTTAAVSTSNVTTNVLTATSGTINGNLNVTGSLMINGENFAESAKGEETVTVKLTLNGSTSTSAINGALIQVIDLTKGTTVNYNWNGNNLVFVIPAGNSYIVKPWTVNSYMPPVQSSATAVKNYARTITLNYTTAPNGVYYCTETGFLKSDSGGAIGIYIGTSSLKRVFGKPFNGYDSYSIFADTTVSMDKGQVGWNYGMTCDPNNGRIGTNSMPSTDYYYYEYSYSTYTQEETVYLLPYWVEQQSIMGKSCYIPAYNEFMLIKNNLAAYKSNISALGWSVDDLPYYGCLISSESSSYSTSIGNYYAFTFYNGYNTWNYFGEEECYHSDYLDITNTEGNSCGTIPCVEY